MKAAAFAYRRPASLAEALSASTGDARVIAGGQSLGPMLNLRLAEPALLVDVRTLPELRGHRLDAGRLIIGAAVTHAEIEDGIVPDTTLGMLPSVARSIAYRAVRNRGTLGGSLAHADPAADWVNAMTALGATLVANGKGGLRRIAVDDFVQGTYRTALAPGEILSAVELPAFSARLRWGYYKICSKVGEFASAIGAVVHDPALGLTRLVAGAVEAKPVVIDDAALLGAPEDSAREAIAARLRAALPGADEVFIHRHAVALVRAIRQMNERAAQP